MDDEDVPGAGLRHVPGARIYCKMETGTNEARAIQVMLQHSELEDTVFVRAKKQEDAVACLKDDQE
jgi:hypothetical protein